MAGGRGNGVLDNKLKTVVEPVILADIKESNLAIIDNDSEIVPYNQLNIRQQRFIDEYMVDLNGTQASIRAGYSPGSASEQGAELLAHSSVRAHIDRRLAEASKRTGVNVDRVIRELARISFASPARVIANDGSIMVDASEDDLAAIQSIKVKTTKGKNGTTVEREVRFYDKNKSLELAGKHIGMFIERKELTINNNFDVTKLSTEEIRIELDKQRRIADLALRTIDVTPQDN